MQDHVTVAVSRAMDAGYVMAAVNQDYGCLIMRGQPANAGGV